MDVTNAQQAELIAAALSARQAAYAPYSKFHVGAALLDAAGRIHAGCNVENASYGLTICAERVAIVSAVAAGSREFVALAVATPGGASPCGACRQFIAEFAPELPILIVDAETGQLAEQTDLGKLLPRQFNLSGE